MGRRLATGALAGLAIGGPVVARPSDLTVTGYAVAIRLPDSGATISARVTVRFTRGPSPVDTLVLDLVGLSVDAVTRSPTGAPAPFAYDGRVIRIPLNDAAAGPGAVVVAYHGTPQDGLFIGANTRGRRVVFADNWPERARYWLPLVDRPDCKAPVEFSVEAPAGWRVVANGGPWGAGWREASPIPTYTMVLGAGELTVSRHRPVVHDRDTIPIEVWTYPEDSAFADSVPFRRATAIVETMERLVGPFPYEKLALVESTTRYGGMENASAIFFAERPYVERTMGEEVVRHETAHQWFGDAVTERAWGHLWLSEGFASYFDLVIGAALHGDSLLADGLRHDAATYFASGVTGRPLVDTAFQDPTTLLNANSYQKGAWVLHMLRAEVGDTAFFRGIREYYRGYRDSAVVSADFRRVMERAAGRDLEWFFHQWLWQPGYPQLRVRWRVDAARHVHLDVAQTQPDAWGVFHLPHLEIETVSASGRRERHEVSLEGRAASMAFDAGEPPVAIHVDPRGRLLAAATVTP